MCHHFSFLIQLSLFLCFYLNLTIQQQQQQSELKLDDNQNISNDLSTTTTTTTTTTTQREFKLNAYVMTLPNDTISEKRLDSFQNAWKKVNIDFPIIPIYAHLHPVRGHGISRGFIKALKQAIIDEVDMALILEDDAWPFKNDEKENFQTELNKLIKLWPSNSIVLLLGGHHIRSTMNSHDIAILKKPCLVEVLNFFGAYAWIVRRNNFKKIISLLNEQLSLYLTETFSPERTLSIFKLPMHVATPLMVDHHEEEGSFSRTWNSTRDSDPWAGRSDWWNALNTPIRPLN